MLTDVVLPLVVTYAGESKTALKLVEGVIWLFARTLLGTSRCD